MREASPFVLRGCCAKTAGAKPGIPMTASHMRLAACSLTSYAHGALSVLSWQVPRRSPIRSDVGHWVHQAPHPMRRTHEHGRVPRAARVPSAGR